MVPSTAASLAASSSPRACAWAASGWRWPAFPADRPACVLRDSSACLAAARLPRSSSQFSAWSRKVAIAVASVVSAGRSAGRPCSAAWVVSARSAWLTFCSRSDTVLRRCRTIRSAAATVDSASVRACLARFTSLSSGRLVLLPAAVEVAQPPAAVGAECSRMLRRQVFGEGDGGEKSAHRLCRHVGVRHWHEHVGQRPAAHWRERCGLSEDVVALDSACMPHPRIQQACRLKRSLDPAARVLGNRVGEIDQPPEWRPGHRGAVSGPGHWPRPPPLALVTNLPPPPLPPPAPPLP